MYPDGYNAFMDYRDGGNGYWAMRAITGATTEAWTVDSAATNTLKAVWVHSVPSVADTAGHSIIAGLLRGDYKASLPSIEVCVTLPGERLGPCSPPCRGSYDCRQPFPRGGFRVPGQTGTGPTNPMIHVEVRDPDQSPLHQVIAAADEDMTKCNASSPCKIQSVRGPVVISFDLADTSSLADESAHIISNDSELATILSESQRLHRAVTFGSRPLCTAQPSDPTCAAGLNGLVALHEYFFGGYDAAHKLVYVGDPQDSQDYVQVPLDQFRTWFRAVYSNEVKPTVCSCGK
jgi:hypothetical protein